jgi:chemotaxis protein CheD
MDIAYNSSKRKITLMPGDYYVSGNEVTISTILGSCISVCLYDPINRIVGMNHFLLSSTRYSKSLPLCLTEAGRYGVHAMELIINGMIKLGAKKKNFHAKAFGGASLFSSDSHADNFNCVGEVNSRFILEFLLNENITLVAADLGGDKGRVIHFHSKDYSVHQKKIKKTVIPELITREKYFRKQESVKKQPEPELWG